MSRLLKTKIDTITPGKQGKDKPETETRPTPGKQGKDKRGTETRPFFSRQLPDDVKLSIVGGVGHWGSEKVAGVSRDFRATVEKARELRMYGRQGLSICACNYHTVISTKGRVYTCGGENDDDEEDEDEDDEDLSLIHI